MKEKEYFKKALKNLVMARKFIEKAEKNEKHRLTLLSKACWRTARFCDYLALTVNDRKRDELFKHASEFDKFYKIFKTLEKKVG
jgi:HD-like signal output (HDOD) protein